MSFIKIIVLPKIANKISTRKIELFLNDSKKGSALNKAEIVYKAKEISGI